MSTITADHRATQVVRTKTDLFRKLLEWGGFGAGAILVAFGVVAIAMGFSGRATVADSLSHSYRTIVLEECVGDKHESPHFANLYDMAVKYADVVPVAEVIAHLRVLEGPN